MADNDRLRAFVIEQQVTVLRMVIKKAAAADLSGEDTRAYMEALIELLLLTTSQPKE